MTSACRAGGRRVDVVDVGRLVRRVGADLAVGEVPHLDYPVLGPVYDDRIIKPVMEREGRHVYG